MVIKLDLKDKKVLTLLDEDSTLSNSQIAKKVQLSKPAIEYRIQRLLKNKAIFEFYTVIDFGKLGYQQYKIYFKFQNLSIEEEKRILNYWANDKNSVWLAQVRGRWDLAVSVLAKNNYDFGLVLNKFLEKFSKFVLEKDILLTEYSLIYSREYLADKKENSKEFVYGIPSKIYELDETDKKILKEISVNARINIVDLAEKTKLSRDVVNYRIKKLTKEKIITGYRCFLNLENIGLRYYKLIIRTKNFDEKAETKLKQFISSHKKATQFLKLIGSWDLEIEFEVETSDELYENLNQIRKDFADIIKEYEVLKITKTLKYNFFPF
ncbi:Lrp/AsnC family transcriptional regulator [Candidatus Pacearchaeota archaeon]|nr:Lrp/AsnC family transcriptional regulator [Candidatus Pacearchaeota archaeon]